MREKLIAALATKFEGVDAKILGRIADKVLSGKTVATEEDVTTAVEGVTLAQILEFYGDSRANEAQKTAVLNYEKKYGLKDGEKTQKEDTGGIKKTTVGEDTTTKKTEPDETAKAILEAITKITERIDKMERGKVTDSRKSRLQKLIEPLTATQKKAYERISLDSIEKDEDFESLMTDIEQEVKELQAESKASAAVFSPLRGVHIPTGQEKKEATQEEVDEIVSAMKL